MFMLDAAVAAVDGDLSNKDGLRAAMKKGDYPSVRGDYTVGRNHFPVQNFVLREVVEGEDGAWVHKTRSVVLENFVDPHAENCSM
jgi:branched-chain amino acid transport system substrate-binding protein